MAEWLSPLLQRQSKQCPQMAAASFLKPFSWKKAFSELFSKHLGPQKVKLVVDPPTV
jgi:hypothetical protein